MTTGSVRRVHAGGLHRAAADLGPVGRAQAVSATGPQHVSQPAVPPQRPRSGGLGRVAEAIDGAHR